MPLNPRQLQAIDALGFYSKALHNTREKFTRPLQEEAMTSQDKEEYCFEASFILQYMIANHEKYSSVLEVLRQDKKALGILGSLCDKLSLDPEQDLQKFIEQAQQLMQNDSAFREGIAALGNSYDKERRLYIRGAGLVFIAAIAVNAAFFPVTSGLILLSLFVLLPSILYLKVSANTASVKNKAYRLFLSDAQSTELPVYGGFTETYTNTVDPANIMVYSKRHDFQPKNEIHNKFFKQAFINGASLNDEVQAEYHALKSR